MSEIASILYGLFVVVMGAIPILAMVVIVLGGYRKLRGADASRLDRVGDPLLRAVNASIYPPALRGTRITVAPLPPEDGRDDPVATAERRRPRRYRRARAMRGANAVHP